MDNFSITSYTTPSPSSSNSSSHTPEINYRRLPQPYHSALHSVRKNVITKKPIAPMPPTPPKIYKVSPVDFRDVVQRLTGALTPTRARLQEVAPPPLRLSPRGSVQEEMHGRKSIEGGGSCGGLSPLGFSLSPSSVAWCSSILMSPRTLSS